MELSHGPFIGKNGESKQASDRLRECCSVYKQLPVNESRTRVLLLHSHPSTTAPISCSLEVMTLDPEPSRTYTALSYVWGDASVTEIIIVNGVPFAVTINLALALRQIRKVFGEVIIWADAISINQRDIPERNQQVLLMKTIYSKAERVIGWLGPDENGGSQALTSLETLLKTAIIYPDNFEWVRKMPELLSVNGTFTGDSGIKFESNDRLEKLLLMLRRPFWTRIWILQELVLPSNLRLFCGEKFTDIPETNSFHKAVNMLSKIHSQRPQSVKLGIWARLNKCMAYFRLLATLRFRRLHANSQEDHAWEVISGFMYARILMESYKTSDPRDHVYGLLGLFDLDIVPDYSENLKVADVYLEVAQCCLNKEPLKKEPSKPEPLDILSLAGIRQNSGGPSYLSHLDLPSWVPDWRFPPPARVRLHRYPQSHAFPSNSRLQMKVIDHKWLRGSAVIWDTILRTESKTGWDLKEWDLAEKIDFEKSSDHTYPSGISRFKAFVLLWDGSYDGRKASGCDLQPDSELFRSYEVIFYANIAQPLAKKYGPHAMPELQRLILGHIELTPVPTAHRESYIVRSRQLRYDMRCFHTEKGYIGFGSLATEVGDIICVLEGHKAPVVLRRQDSHYILVGDCDVVGIMNGEVLEAVRHGGAEITEIEIR